RAAGRGLRRGGGRRVVDPAPAGEHPARRRAALMHLYAVPMVFILIGLTLYVVLGGADFGAAIWQLHTDAEIRDFAHDSMAPVWEANHVWLIFVLTVMWTAYPTAFGSIASTLSV